MPSSAEPRHGDASPRPRVPGRPFPKGKSANPGGRPKTVNDFKELLKQDLFAGRQALLAALKKPGERVGAATVIFQYVLGRPAATVNLRLIQSIEDLSEEELRAIAGLGQQALTIDAEDSEQDQ